MTYNDLLKDKIKAIKDKTYKLESICKLTPNNSNKKFYNSSVGRLKNY